MQVLALGDLLYDGCVCLCVGECGWKAEGGRLRKNAVWSLLAFGMQSS